MQTFAIENTIDIAAPAAQVYRALTTLDGVRGWWTPDCELGSRVGDAAVFRFDQKGTEMRFRIDRLEPGRSVEWVCDGHKNNPDWQDTRVAFALSTAGEKTRVKLAHTGWRDKGRVYGMCVDGWAHFMNSLRSYVETGTGTPHGR